ncbi:hypothetical protein ACFL2O_00835 [Thermodesulfobacteriota bacterium]
MLTKEGLIKKIDARKANRENEINQIPIEWMRKKYQKKLENDERMNEYFLELGDVLLNRYNKPIPRIIFYLMNAFFGLSLFKKQFHLGGAPRDFIDSILDYVMFVSSYGAWPIEIEEVTENRVVAYLDQCTVKCDNHLKLCRAATSMEPRLSKKPWFGAKVAYTERIPEGAQRCKLVFERK